MKTMKELIEQNVISIQAAEFLVACLHAHLTVVIWSPLQDDANVLAEALQASLDNAVIINLNETSSTEQIGLIATYLSPIPHGVSEQIKDQITAHILVHLIKQCVQTIIDISTDMAIPVFEFDTDSSLLKPTGLRPPLITKLNDENIILPPSVFGVAAPRDKSDTGESLQVPSPKPEPSREEQARSEESQIPPQQGGSTIFSKILDGVKEMFSSEKSDTDRSGKPAEEDIDDNLSLGSSSPEPDSEPQAPAAAIPGTGTLDRRLGEKKEETAKEELAETSEEVENEKAAGLDIDAAITRTGTVTIDLLAMINSLDEIKRQQFITRMGTIPTKEQTPEAIQALYDEISGASQAKEAQFTAYYARQTVAKTEYGFYVYAHLPDALISADIQQFAADLGGHIPKPAIATQTATLEEGAMLTAMIHCDALKFNQIGVMKKWQAPFVRFDFRYTAPEALIDEFVEGRIAIMLGMIEIASIDFQTLVTAPQAINLMNTIPDDPTRQVHFEATNPASMYQKIFISYSRKDTVIAEEFRKAQIMMGNTIFMDTHTIRAGEAWEEALKRFIREADVFQLFWSEHSASSEHVKFEWEYALNYRCSETHCVGFIRPAYWEKPFPTPPPELSHLHFAYVPQEGIV